MKNEAKQIVEAVASHPKTSAIVASSPLYAFINQMNPVLDFVATIMGIALVGVLMRYHWQNTKKLNKEIKERKINSSSKLDKS